MTFASPWAEAPLRPDQDFVTPACFNQHTPPKLLPGSMHKFRTETLLYAFYSMPGEEAQVSRRAHTTRPVPRCALLARRPASALHRAAPASADPRGRCSPRSCWRRTSCRRGVGPSTGSSRCG